MRYEHEHIEVKDTARAITVLPVADYTLDTGYFARWTPRGRGYRKVFDNHKATLEELVELNEAILDGRIAAWKS